MKNSLIIPCNAPDSLGGYEIFKKHGEQAKIRHIESKEIMHPSHDPSYEAEHLYVNQSNLNNRVSVVLSGLDSSLTLWDVGLGAGTNAMAAVRCILEVEKKAEFHQSNKVKLISFENDLDSFRLALNNCQQFNHLQHESAAQILQSGQWTSPQGLLTWHLIEGDFQREMMSAPQPNLIYFDPFSYKTDSNLWTLECFKSLFKKCRGVSTELYTYSASTSVRAGLLGAGFFVGRGIPTGPKKETTFATNYIDSELPFKKKLLGIEWLGRWERSDSRYPANLNEQERLDLDKKIRGHIQFRSDF